MSDVGHGTSPVEHPGFICRREGHDPALKIVTPMLVESIICSCLRCGKVVEVKASEVKHVG